MKLNIEVEVGFPPVRAEDEDPHEHFCRVVDWEIRALKIVLRAMEEKLEEEFGLDRDLFRFILPKVMKGGLNETETGS